MCVDAALCCFKVQLKLGRKFYFFYLHIVNIGTDLIHAICRRADNEIIQPGFAEGSLQNVNALITTIT